MKCALYPGTFDPVTNGHIWIVVNGLKLFDKITIMVARNASKTPMFTPDERVVLWQECFRETEYQDRVSVVAADDQYAVRYAKSVGCDFLLRGLRTAQDYADETALQQIDFRLEPTVQPGYLMSDPEHVGVSSSVVKGMVGYKGWEEAIQPFVPKSVWEALVARKHAGK